MSLVPWVAETNITTMSNGFLIRLYSLESPSGRPLNDPEVQCLITELSKFFQFNSNLYNLRKAYIPQCGKSQQGVSDIQKTILQASLDYIAAKEAAYDAEFGMDDEALEAAYTAQGLAVVKDEDGKIIGVQG